MKNSIIEWVIRLLGGITKDQWKRVVQYVAEKALTNLTNEQKRADVVEQLGRIGITGSRANWLVETAVTWLKRVGQIPV
jgi:hypothetical protein